MTLVPSPASDEGVASSSTEVLEMVASSGEGGREGEREGVVSRGSGQSIDDPLIVGGEEDYLQGEDPEIITVFSGMYVVYV